MGSRSSPNGHHQEKSSSSAPTKASSGEKRESSPKPSSHQHDKGASPIIRSGLDVLQGKDLPKFGGFGYPPGFDPTNPAFRLPFFASAHHAHLLGYGPGGPGGPGFPPGSLPPGSPYSLAAAYGRKEGMAPVCKDPYCNGCQFSASGPGGPSASSQQSAFMAAAAAAMQGGHSSVCPAGCAQCDHQKFPLIPSATSGPYPNIPGFPSGLSHAALSAAAAAAASGYPPSFLSHPHHAAAAAAMMHQQQAAAVAAAAASAQQQNAQRPYVCNWIHADSYCGKRFPTSEELLQHLRTHTNSSNANASNSSSAPSVPTSEQSQALAVAVSHANLQSAAASSLYSSALLNSSAMAAAAAAMHRTYPTPPLSPHSAARYNPYAVAAAAAASGKPPGPMGPFPPPPSALANYYPSPYSLYGPRIG